MQVIIRNKATFDTIQYDNVTNIAYDGTTKIVTISYGTDSTVSYNSESYLIFVRSIM